MSTLANLESRTTSQAAQAPAPASLKTGAHLTAQYLYDVLMTDNDSTKLSIAIKAAKVLDTQTFKSLLADFVKLAEQYGEDKKKTAQNHQSVLRSVYGALRFGKAKLDELGFSEQATGYQDARVLCKTVLDSLAIRWDGSKKEDEGTKEARKLAKLEENAYKEAQKTISRDVGETFEQYHQRILTQASAILQAEKENAQNEEIAKLAEKVTALCGDSLAQVLEYLLNRDFEVQDAPL
jgi:hypothetical protein